MTINISITSEAIEAAIDIRQQAVNDALTFELRMTQGELEKCREHREKYRSEADILFETLEVERQEHRDYQNSTDLLIKQNKDLGLLNLGLSVEIDRVDTELKEIAVDKLILNQNYERLTKINERLKVEVIAAHKAVTKYKTSKDYWELLHKCLD
jgi:hypothetical protein